MITVPLISWQPIANMPEDRREADQLLLAVGNRLGTVDGGDGVKLNLKWPWIYYIASWDGEGWATTESEQDGSTFRLSASDPAYWADINPPE